MLDLIFIAVTILFFSDRARLRARVREIAVRVTRWVLEQL